jgi:CRP-like cAMP-binding protein
MLEPSAPTSAAALATRNRLLAALAPDELETMLPWLEPVELVLRHILYEPDVEIQHVYFPTSGAVSMIVLAPEGAVEVGSVGNEGFTGVCTLLFADSMPMRAIVQGDGQAYRMKVGIFRTLVSESLAMRQLFSRYALALSNQAAQSVACNRLHSLDARCARWLLSSHDRVEGDRIVLTQEFLSYMLGVHRPAVTLAVGTLQKAGLIHCSRGKIEITNRRGLEQASCSCYQEMRDDFDQLVNSRAAFNASFEVPRQERARAAHDGDSDPSRALHDIQRAPRPAGRGR